MDAEPDERPLIVQHRSRFPPEPQDGPGGLSNAIFPTVPVLLEPLPGIAPSAQPLDGPGGSSEANLPMVPMVNPAEQGLLGVDFRVSFP